MCPKNILPRLDDWRGTPRTTSSSLATPATGRACSQDCSYALPVPSISEPYSASAQREHGMFPARNLGILIEGSFIAKTNCAVRWPQPRRAAIAKATIRSGHELPVSTTKAAAATTAAFPIASLRENSQTARTFASPARCGTRTIAAATLTANATNASGTLVRPDFIIERTLGLGKPARRAISAWVSDEFAIASSSMRAVGEYVIWAIQYVSCFYSRDRRRFEIRSGTKGFKRGGNPEPRLPG